MKLLSILLAAPLLLLAGCDRDSAVTSTDTRTSVTLQLNWKAEPQFGGFFAGKVHEIYAKHGLNVEITEGGASAPTVDMVAAGTVPFAIVSGDEIVIARSRGKKIVALFAVYQTHPQGIMARASRGFTTIEDVFKNEGTLAMEQGLGYSEFLKRKYGFEKLQIVPTPFGDLSFFRDNEKYSMQVFVTSEPLAARRIGLDVSMFLIADAGYNPYATVLATSEDYLNKNRATAEAMVNATREAWQKYLSDPGPTNELMRRLNPTMEEETFAAAAEAQRALIETEHTNRRGLGTMTVERWQALIDQLISLGIIDKPVAASACFVEFNPAPAPAPATMPAIEWTHVLLQDEPYYLTGPQQGRPPEGTLKAGVRVRIVESAGSYSRITSETGTTAWVSSTALQPLER